MFHQKFFDFHIFLFTLHSFSHFSSFLRRFFIFLNYFCNFDNKFLCIKQCIKSIYSKFLFVLFRKIPFSAQTSMNTFIDKFRLHFRIHDLLF